MTQAVSRLVWDLPVRATHWMLVLAVAGCWATHYAGVEWFNWHRRLGYVVLVLVTIRVVWGFVGTRHARFAGFLCGPRVMLQFLRGDTAATVGHNPLGALSVIALLAVLLLQALTGLFANDEIMNAGPFYGWIAPQLSNRISAVHGASSNLQLALIALHLAAVAWYVRARGQPLVRAMVTGRKPADLVPPAEEIASSRTLLALALVAALVAVLALALEAAPEATIALY